MLAKSTSSGITCEERKTGESSSENSLETSGKLAGATHHATCLDESLLKACVSRQEKTSCCNRNSAARNAHSSDLRSFTPRTQVEVAWPTHLHSLSHMNSPIRRHNAARNQITDGAPGC